MHTCSLKHNWQWRSWFESKTKQHSDKVRATLIFSPSLAWFTTDTIRRNTTLIITLTWCFRLRLINSFFSRTLPADSLFSAWGAVFSRLSLLFVFWDLRVVPIPVVLDPLQDLSCVWMNQIAPSLPERLDNEIDKHHLGGEAKEEPSLITWHWLFKGFSLNRVLFCLH